MKFNLKLSVELQYVVFSCVVFKKRLLNDTELLYNLFQTSKLVILVIQLLKKCFVTGCHKNSGIFENLL